jgi:4-amino-4-deoxy-L-arabinose transferase-like glycosyltransferase
MKLSYIYSFNKSFSKALVKPGIISNELVLFVVIIAVAAFLRLFLIGERPGFEWDEPVYGAIAQHSAEHGLPALRPEGGAIATQPYLYHPPFDVIIKGWWISLTGESGVGNLRLLAGFASLVLLALAYWLVRNCTDRFTAALATILLATDGWLIYTNRLNLIENIMMPLGLAGMVAYSYAIKRHNRLLYGLAGALLALAFVYKHIGIAFLVAPLFYLLFFSDKRKSHIFLYLSALTVIVTYFVAMYLLWGNEIFSQNWVQIQRSLGLVESRGLNYGLAQVFEALLKTYWIFFSTLFALAICLVLLAWRFYRWLRKGERPAQPLLFSWAVTAFVLLSVTSLKAPHYLIVMLVPLYIYLATELATWLRQLKKTQLKWGFVALILTLNMVTWNVRFMLQSDNALLETYRFVSANVPANARVLTEETIGAGIRQPYYKLDRHKMADELEKIKPDYIILYYSTTQKPPDSEALEKLVKEGQALTEIRGFKERIIVYRVNQSS